jgi:hypothetical protein
LVAFFVAAVMIAAESITADFAIVQAYTVV